MILIKAEPRSKASQEKEVNTYEMTNSLLQGWELILNAFKSEIFPLKSTQGKELKIISPKQMY